MASKNARDTAVAAYRLEVDSRICMRSFRQLHGPVAPRRNLGRFMEPTQFAVLPVAAARMGEGRSGEVEVNPGCKLEGCATFHLPSSLECRRGEQRLRYLVLLHAF